MSRSTSAHWLSLALLLTGFIICMPLILSLSGCGGPKIVDGYRPDETAQLTLLLRQVLDKANSQDFVGLYRTFAGKRFQQHWPERQFLRHTHCVSKTFGELHSIPTPLPAFSRAEHPTFGVTDRVSVPLGYAHGPMVLQVIAMPYSDSFKLWSLEWEAKYPASPQGKAFSACLAKVGSF